MSQIPTARASYQPTATINRVGHREPFACPSVRNTLNAISKEATAMQSATTQAAYLMRLNNLKALYRSLV